MNEITAWGTAQLLPSNKDQVAKFVTILRNALESGDINPLSFAIQMKAMEEVAERLRKDPFIQDIIIEELEKYGKETVYNGVKFNIRENGTRYDFTACEDSVYEDLKYKVDILTKELKDRENWLKGIKPGYPAVDKETGEIINPPTKKSTTGVVITL